MGVHLSISKSCRRRRAIIVDRATLPIQGAVLAYITMENPLARPGSSRAIRCRRALTACLLLAAAILVLALACRGSGPAPRRAVLILLDAARDDRFGSYGYRRATTPHMDQLAARGLVVSHHYAQGTHTRQSLPALLYSRYFANPIFPYDPHIPFADPKTLLRRDDDELFSLPRALADEGFKTAAITSHVWLKAGTRFAREFQELFDLSTLEGYDPKYAYPRGEQVIDRAIDWLEDNRRRDVFLYLHFMDTHFPHFFEADAQAFVGADPIDPDPFRPDGIPKQPGQPLSAAGRTYLDALYDGSLRYADRQVGRLTRFLERRGMLDDTLIVVTSDHGEHLLETPKRVTHGGPWYENVARIPLIIFYPGRVSSGRLESLTEAVDVSPTILGLLGVPVPGGRQADGVDLSAVVKGDLPAKAQVFMTQGIRDQHHKALFHDPPATLLSARIPAVEQLSGELYDLEADPGERNDLWSSDLPTAARLYGAFRRHMLSRYERAEAAVNHDPPEGPFAIGARHFRPDLDLPELPLDAPAAEVHDLADDSGWILLFDWQRQLLIAKQGAAALPIAIPLPNGEYQVIAQIRGSCIMAVGRGLGAGTESPRELRAPGFDLSDRVRGFAAPIGSVVVEDGSFRANITPLTDESWFSIQFLGFTPADGALPSQDKDQLDRLRTLGYVD